MSLATATATMSRATRFLATGMAIPGAAPPGAIAGPSREKVIGNGLRELDRFLNVLIDEVAAASDACRLDLPALRRQRNTANKLRDVCTALALACPDDARLRAIARARDCLFHTAGIVRHGAAMHGWRSADAAERPGDRLVVSAADLAELCAFYARISANLVAQSRA